MLSNSVKRDPRVVRTRKLLIDAFIEVQREKNFDDITIQDITDRATVNRATFYAHFQDKYDLLDRIIHDSFADVLEARLRIPTHNHREHLRQLLLAITDHLGSVQTQCQRSYRMFGNLDEAQIKAQIREHLQEWLAEDLAFRKISPQQRDLAARLLSWSLYGAASEWQQQTERSTPEQIAEQAMPMISASLEALLY